MYIHYICILYTHTYFFKNSLSMKQGNCYNPKTLNLIKKKLPNTIKYRPK